MPEDLKNLLEKIQKDGVEKAEAEAAGIVAEAKKKAAEILSEAESSARTQREQSEQEAAAFMERAAKSLEQAARDVVLSVGEAVNATFGTLVKNKVSEALTPETLKQMIVAIVDSYAADKQSTSQIQVLLPPDKQKQVTDLLMAEFREQMAAGIEIKADDSVISGFRISLVDDQLEHDFSGKAIAESLCQLIRPHLAEIVRNAFEE